MSYYKVKIKSGRRQTAYYVNADDKVQAAEYIFKAFSILGVYITELLEIEEEIPTQEIK